MSNQGLGLRLAQGGGAIESESPSLKCQFQCQVDSSRFNGPWTKGVYVCLHNNAATAGGGYIS